MGTAWVMYEVHVALFSCSPLVNVRLLHQCKKDLHATVDVHSYHSVQPRVSCYIYMYVAMWTALSLIIMHVFQLHMYFLFVQSLPVQALLFKLDVRISTCICTQIF